MPRRRGALPLSPGDNRRDAGPPQQRKQALSRERIVVSAVELLEREGEDALSMRRIAADLGYGVMSLYNHVPNKAALLDAIAEHVMGALQFAADPRATGATRRGRLSGRSARSPAGTPAA